MDSFILILLSCLLVGVTIIVSLAVVIFSHFRHKKRCQEYSDALSPLNMEISEHLVARSKQFIMNYHTLQVTSKALNVLCVQFSVLSLLSVFTEDLEISLALSSLCIFFVICAVYINPMPRARDYLLGWRKADACIIDVIHNAQSILSDETHKAKMAKQCAKCIKSIEEDCWTEES